MKLSQAERFARPHLFKRAASIAAATWLALAGVSALAQSSVTIAGRLDGALQRIDTGNSTRIGIDSGTYTASRLIFRGTEDLGGGLRALLYLENGFNLDVGAQQLSGKLFNRGSYVGLSGQDWGTVTLGRQYMPIFWSFLFADDTGPLRLHNYSAVQSVQRSNFARVGAAASPIKAGGTLDSVGGGIYSLNITSAFEDNSIVYKSPAFGGATVMLGYSAPEGYTAGGSGKVLGGNIEYRSTDFYASVAFNDKRGKVPVGGAVDEKVREQLVSALYNVTKEFHVWGNIHPWKFDSNGVGMKGRDWMLGVSYWMPAGELWLNYAKKKIDNCADCGTKGLGIGYQHFLSKRTELYASYAKVSNHANSANTLNGFAPDALGRNVSGLAAGIAHQF